MHKKFLTVGIVASIFIFVYEMVVHMGALGSTYEATASVWRPEAAMMDLWWFSIAIQVATGFAMACYMSKRDISGQKAGIAFGSMIGVFFAINAFGMYAFLPISFALAALWAVAAWVKFVLVGAIIGRMYAK